MRSKLELLHELQSTVRECLAALDGAAPNEPEVGRAFERLSDGFARLGDPAEWLPGFGGEEREQLEEELSTLARSHAVLTAAVAKDRERLARLLEKARAARSGLRGAAAPAQPGRRLDRSA